MVLVLVSIGSVTIIHVCGGAQCVLDWYTALLVRKGCVCKHPCLCSSVSGALNERILYLVYIKKLEI
jgi:hypothetical protein